MARPNTPLMASKSADSQKRRIWRNVIGLVAGVGIFTMGLNPMDDLQSWLNDGGGLGIGLLSIKYAFMILGNLFTNTLIIRKLGSKRALILGTLLYCLYIVANFYPSWSTMVPLTVLSGLGGALMWTTQSHYLAILAENLARLRLEGVAAATASSPSATAQAPASTASAISYADNVKTMIFGFRGMAIRLSAIVGGLASSLILQSIGSSGDVSKIVVKMGVCKAEFCTACKDVGLGFLDALGADVSQFGPNSTHQHSPQTADHVSGDNAHDKSSSKMALCATRCPASMTAVYVLCAFCTASAILGVLLMMLCVDQLPKKAKTNEAEEDKEQDDEEDQLDSPCSLMLATVRLWKRKEQLFMIPMTIACGFQEAFWRADFNKTPITCALGIQQITFILVCYYTAMLVGSSMCGSWLGNRRTRTIALPAMVIVDMVSLSAMFLWKLELVASIRSTTIAYVATAITGTMYGAISSLLPAFYGIVFPNDLEAAYSNLFFWCFMGSTLMYALSHSLCLAIKLAIVLVMITIGLLGYLATEFTIHESIMRSELAYQSNIAEYRR